MSTEIYCQNICANIRFLRARYGLSRTAMARRLHITRKSLDSPESGVVPDRIGIHFLFYIRHSFGIPLKQLLDTRLDADSPN